MTVYEKILEMAGSEEIELVWYAFGAMIGRLHEKDFDIEFTERKIRNTNQNINERHECKIYTKSFEIEIKNVKINRNYFISTITKTLDSPAQG